MIPEDNIRLKRVYDRAEDADGVRLLADRLWPRGIKKTDLVYDDWIKDLCPSDELRKAWHQHVLTYEAFTKRYLQALQSESEALERLASLAEKEQITLLSAVKDLNRSHLPVLRQAILQKTK